MIATSRNVVAVRGEQPSQIWWRGAQWAVTTSGIERLDGTYSIKADRLLEDEPDYSWPEHMAGKGWIDVDEFVTAWLVALAMHGYDGKLTPDRVHEIVRRTYREARAPADASADIIPPIGSL
jgi:hypothetical protein